MDFIYYDINIMILIIYSNPFVLKEQTFLNKSWPLRKNKKDWKHDPAKISAYTAKKNLTFPL